MPSQKYLFIYRNPPSDHSMQVSPEEIQAMMAPWRAWKEKFAANIVDLGDGLKPGGRQFAAGVVTDGAFIESKEVVGGFSIVAASGYDEAVEIARGCPIVHMPGSHIEIRELAGF